MLLSLASFIFLLLFFCLSTATQQALTVHNGSEVHLHCAPAELFARTHMAPDFESPQLIRSLDWFHDESLVASFRSRNGWAGEKWVAGSRLQLVSPFFSLRLSPVKVEDSGLYSCRFETDPLFQAIQNQAQTLLTVIVRPVPPSAPMVKSSSPSSATLSWTHSTTQAHRPILRYSVVVRSVTDGARFVIAAPSNATTVIVDNLTPDTEYAFSVRGENAAGSGEFGPETNFVTLGIPPSTPPTARVGNSTSRCVSLVLTGPLPASTQHLLLSLRHPNETLFKETRLDKTIRHHQICQLHPFSIYNLSLVSVSPHGSSPPFSANFETDQEVPGSAPRELRVEGVYGRPSLIVSWAPPLHPNGVLTTYHIYQKVAATGKWKADVLKIKGREEKQRYRIEIKGLLPATRYSIRVSASTIKGEGEKSPEKGATTDVAAPDVSKIEHISWDTCGDSVVTFFWSDGPKEAFYAVELESEEKVTRYNSTNPKLQVTGIRQMREYSVKVKTSLKSLVSPHKTVDGDWSRTERFSLNPDCAIYSTVCPATSRLRCLPLAQSLPSTSQPFSPVIVFSSILFFLLLILLTVFFLKRFHRCFGVKRLLKKREKSIYVEELNPLVYDSIGCEKIPVELFYGYCEDLAREDGLKYRGQFEQIERMTADCGVTRESLVKYADKNRYANIGALETSRVRLTGATSDYINANYVDSCEKKNAYIATQAPLASTIGDFYQMLWQERSNIVLMIANIEENGLKKCDQYWPTSSHSTESYGNFQVSLISQTSCAHFVHRILSVKISKCVPQTERRLHQLQFFGWPDHGVPTSPFPLLSFVHAVAQIHSTGPIVVHCSAGVGRSGSFIVIDSMRRRLLSNRSLNLMGHLAHIRKQRERLVQNVEQYMFCHEAVRQLIRHGITRIQASLFTKYVRYLAEANANGRSRILAQFEDLCKCSHSPHCPPSADYLILPGFHRLDEFLVGGWSNECDDLWRNVWKHAVHTILLIGNEKDFWKGQEKFDDISLVRDDDTMLLSDGEQQLKVRLLCIEKEDFDADTWGRIEAVQSERLCSHHRPLMVVAPSEEKEEEKGEGKKLADSRAFLFCALTGLACQFEQQGCLDIIQMITLYSHAQCGIWKSSKDIEFIYERALQLIMLANS
ncbi:unnamed protein product, partial [Mesorhabditis belari]|uniref:protein-tyrosine-phosphatase n=1 Tax=Mesorhabditis belari TaxID=2138241 RepID=A0AAF3FFQ8_9BILA